MNSLPRHTNIHYVRINFESPQPLAGHPTQAARHNTNPQLTSTPLPVVGDENQDPLSATSEVFERLAVEQEEAESREPARPLVATEYNRDRNHTNSPSLSHRRSSIASEHNRAMRHYDSRLHTYEREMERPRVIRTRRGSGGLFDIDRPRLNFDNLVDRLLLSILTEPETPVPEAQDLDVTDGPGLFGPLTSLDNLNNIPLEFRDEIVAPFSEPILEAEYEIEYAQRGNNNWDDNNEVSDENEPPSWMTR